MAENEIFSMWDFEKFYNEVLDKDRQHFLRLYDKLASIDSTGPQQTFILLSKLGELGLKHKELVLSKYIELIREQKELIGFYLRILEAGAGNISPAANLVSLLQLVIQFINISSLLTALGSFQGDFRKLAAKPILMYVSEIVQQTEDLAENNLQTAYDTLQKAIILPDKVLR